MSSPTYGTNSQSTIGESPILPQGMIPLAPMQLGKVPKYRLDNPTKARSIVVNLWQASQQRNLELAAQQGQIDGNPPYNPQAMRRAGRAGDANFNTLEAKALCSTAMVPYYDLFAGGNRFVEVMLDELGESPDPDSWQVQYASGVVSEEYDQMLRRWRNWESVMYSMMRDYIVFGKGYLVWRPNGNWRSQKIAHYRVFVPDAQPVDMDEVELIVVWQNLTVTFLMDAIRDEAAASAAGWDIEEVKKAMMAAVPVDPAVPNDPVLAQAQLRDSDIYVSARNSTAQLATIYVKEFDGKWSELIVRRDQIPSMGQAVSQMDQADFIFKRFSYYENVWEFMCPFFLESADANWKGTSGMARDIFSYAQLKDRMACTQADAVFLRNSIVLQPRQEMDRNKLSLMQLGRMTILPPGLEAQQANVLGDIASTIEVGRELQQQIERNTGIYRPTLEKGGGNPSTLGEFQQKFAQATVLSSSAITRFYSQLDRYYEEQWYRTLESVKGTDFSDEKKVLKMSHNDDWDDWRAEAKRFVARCALRGITLEQLKKCKFVRAFRAVGNGSASMRQQIASTFLSPQVYPYFPPDGQMNILEDFTRTLGGQTAVNRYIPSNDRQGLPNDQQWEAMIENAALKEQAPVTWTPSQQNLVHIPVHLQAASQAAASLQQGGDPHQVLAYMDAIGPHVQVHLQKESQKPASQALLKQFTEVWKRLAQFADKLRGQLQMQAQQQQRLQQQAQQTLDEAQVDMMKVQADTQTSRAKAQALIGLKKERQDAELALKAQKQAGDMALQDASTASGIAHDTAKTRADIIHKTAKTASDIKNAKAKAESSSGEA